MLRIFLLQSARSPTETGEIGETGTAALWGTRTGGKAVTRRAPQERFPRGSGFSDRGRLGWTGETGLWATWEIRGTAAKKD